MQDEMFALSERDVERIKALLDAFESGRLNPRLDTGSARRNVPHYTGLVIADEEIPGMSGTTPGTGNATTQIIANGYDVFAMKETDTVIPGNAVSDTLLANLSSGAISSGVLCVTVREPVSGMDVAIPLDAGPGMEWVRILCPSEGAHGYPGLLQTYDPDAQAFNDVDGRNQTVSTSVATGSQVVTVGDTAGILAGSVLIAIDGFCSSESVQVISVAGKTFTASFAGALIANGVASITVTSPGSGYASSGIPPTVSFTGGGGAGAAAIAVLDVATGDVVASFTITNPGSNYTSAPTVVISNSGTSGTGAAGAAVLSGLIKVYLDAIWVQFNPNDFTPVPNDVSAPVYYIARQEGPADDGLLVFLALGGQTLFVLCTDGSSFTFYAGRLITSTNASS